MIEPAGFFVWVTDTGVRALGSFGERTRLAIDGVENYVAAQHSARADHRLFANPAIYRAVARVRLPLADGLLSLTPSPALDETLARAAAGATAEALAQALVDDEVSLDEALEFVHGLVAREVLLANAAPQYNSIAERQWARGEATLSRAAALDLARQLTATPPPSEFVRAFVTRFGDDEVPLLFALDPEAGVRFDGALHNDLVIARCRLDGERLVPLGEGALSLISEMEPLAAPLRALHAAEEALQAGAAFAEVRCAGDPPRVRLREFEIACGTRGETPHIPLDDLRLSIVDERVMLRSARLAREVAPRRSADSPPPRGDLAAFLCAAQQNSPPPAGAWLDIPFLRTTPRKPPRTHRPTRRFFGPGSEWCELQLFGPSLDVLVIDLLSPLTRERRFFDGWFFLRGRSHLAVALHGGDRGALLARVEDLAAPLLADGRLHEYALVPYRRQVARFGGAEGILVAERIFEADSEAVCALLDALDVDDAQAREELALLGLAALYDDFGLLPRPLAASDDHPATEILRARSSRVRQQVSELRALADLSRSLDELASSHAHFFANRFLRSPDDERAINARLRRIYWKEE